jgi:hypothetical protein
MFDNLPLLPSEHGVTEDFVEDFERTGHEFERGQRIAGDTNFTNAFVLRPRFPTTLANWPTKPLKGVSKATVVRGTGVGAKALTAVDKKKAAQSKLSGFWLTSPSGLRRQDLFA